MHPLNPTGQVRARVGICIATFRRRELLRQLLAGVSRLKFEKMPLPEILVIVVDNDMQKTAEEICNKAKLPWPLKYVVEPRRGIAQARNRAILEADNPDYIVFVDDDEVPTPMWLDELLWTAACFKGDIVCGPVLPRFASGVPEWVKTSEFFTRNGFATGHPIETCGTGNVLISRKVIQTLCAFDEKFALSGAEDTHFFLRARRAGYGIVCSGAGLVYEEVPASRASLRGILRRAYQSGNSWVLCESTMDRRSSTRIIRAAKAIAHILQGAGSACFSPVFGKAALAKSLRNMFLGAGMLAALAGRNFQGYRSATLDSTE